MGATGPVAYFLIVDKASARAPAAALSRSVYAGILNGRTNMRTSIRLALALTTLVAVLCASRPALATDTLTGTVGEIGILTDIQVIRFNFTDATQTAGCVSQPKYAIVPNGLAFYREIYAALLVSKKGANLSCAVDNKNSSCQVVSCTLP